MNRISKITQHLSKATCSNNNCSSECPACPSCRASARSSGAGCPVLSASSSMPKKPVKVLVTGAAGNIAYSILFGVGRGKLLGFHQPIELVLLDIPMMANKMNGVVMELEDCAFPLITKIVATTDYKTAFSGVEIALLIGAKPRSKGMVRADLLKANASIFKGQGQALEKYADRNVKVVVVGNPANTNCLITLRNAPSINPRNFTAMTRLDQNRACSQISNKIGCQVSDVHNIIIWGNHSKTQYPDVSHAYVTCPGAKTMITSVRSAVNDDDWLVNAFIPLVQGRGAAIIKARGLSSAASAANACLDHIRDWVVGTRNEQVVSMAVLSNGEYGVPKGIVYSFPCTCTDGEWKIAEHLPISAASRKRMQATADELIKERETAFSL